MARKGRSRRTRYVRLGNRRSSGKSVGIGTSLGAVIAVAPILGAGTDYNMQSEIQSAFRGEQGIPDVLYKLTRNTIQGLPIIIGGLAIPMLAKKLLPNPTVAKLGRARIKAV